MADWSPLRDLLAEVDTSRRFDWQEVDRLVGGLPRSAYVHNAFWKGARTGWQGFTTADVRIGESVTFVRAGSTAPPEPTSSPLTHPAHSDVVLVGCVKQKLDRAAPARDLYVSALFRKERRYAEQAGVPWFILSALHGVLAPTDVIEPYDLRLSTTSRAYRSEWGQRVVEQLATALGALEGRMIELHAGSSYTDAIRHRLLVAGGTASEPLSGLRSGQRLAWYDARVRTIPRCPAPNVGELVRELSDRSHAISPSEFLSIGAAEFASPGLYSWWVDIDGASDLAAGLGHQVEAGLIYAGLAGATRSSGRKSSNTLWGRIKTMHLGGRHEFSTFRLSLGSVLASATGASEIDEAALTAWMHAHLRLVAMPVSDADNLGAVETEVLAALDPPLNLNKVTRNDPRRKLSELRKRYSRKRRRT